MSLQPHAVTSCKRQNVVSPHWKAGLVFQQKDYGQHLMGKPEEGENGKDMEEEAGECSEFLDKLDRKMNKKQEPVNRKGNSP